MQHKLSVLELSIFTNLSKLNEIKNKNISTAKDKGKNQKSYNLEELLRYETIIKEQKAKQCADQEKFITEMRSKEQSLREEIEKQHKRLKNVQAARNQIKSNDSTELEK